MLKTDTHSVDILIVGGGTAGITVAASLAKRKIFSSITILEPSKVHYYQPLWTLVGAGIFPKESSEKREADLIPSGVDWIQDAAETFLPETNRVITTTGREIIYRYLVVCPGMEIFWDKIQTKYDNIKRKFLTNIR